MSAPPDPAPDANPNAGLVARYREPLIRYFSRRGLEASGCEDLAHDTFVRLFSLKRADHVDNAEAYLFQIAGSVLNDHLRKQKVRRQHANLVEDMYANLFAAPDAEHVLEGKQAFERFKAALNELKPRVRDTFLLARIEGLAYTQIAVRFGISVRTVEHHVAQAVAHLTKRLKEPK